MAARSGILVKGGGIALERSHKVDIIAFDKTGTLTHGKPVVTESMVFPNSEFPSENDIWVIISTVESASDHPLAKAAVFYATQKSSMNSIETLTLSNGLFITHIEEIGGRGLKARLSKSKDGIDKDNAAHHIYIGNQNWLNEMHCEIDSNSNRGDSALIDIIRAWQSKGHSIIFVGIRSIDSIRGKIIGLFALADSIRSESKEILKQLRKKNIDVWMITGDHPITANAIGKELEFNSDKIISQVLPHEKAEKIRYLQEIQGKNGKSSIVAMVGDGINDSPALAQADIG